MVPAARCSSQVGAGGPQHHSAALREEEEDEDDDGESSVLDYRCCSSCADNGSP